MAPPTADDIVRVLIDFVNSLAKKTSRLSEVASRQQLDFSVSTFSGQLCMMQAILDDIAVTWSSQLFKNKSCYQRSTSNLYTALKSFESFVSALDAYINQHYATKGALAQIGHQVSLQLGGRKLTELTDLLKLLDYQNNSLSLLLQTIKFRALSEPSIAEPKVKSSGYPKPAEKSNPWGGKEVEPGELRHQRLSPLDDSFLSHQQMLGQRSRIEASPLRQKQDSNIGKTNVDHGHSEEDPSFTSMMVPTRPLDSISTLSTAPLHEHKFGLRSLGSTRGSLNLNTIAEGRQAPTDEQGTRSMALQLALPFGPPINVDIANVRMSRHDSDSDSIRRWSTGLFHDPSEQAHQSCLEQAHTLGLEQTRRPNLAGSKDLDTVVMRR